MHCQLQDTGLSGQPSNGFGCLQTNPSQALDDIHRKVKKTFGPVKETQEVENINRQIISKEIDSVIKKFSTNKSPGPESFIGDFYQTLTTIFLNLLKKKKIIGRNTFEFILQA